MRALVVVGNDPYRLAQEVLELMSRPERRPNKEVSYTPLPTLHKKGQDTQQGGQGNCMNANVAGLPNAQKWVRAITSFRASFSVDRSNLDYSSTRRPREVSLTLLE